MCTAARLDAGPVGTDGAEAANRIYQALVLASGDSRQAPPLEIRTDADRARMRDGRRVAWFDPRANKIGIDEKVLQICSGMQGRGAEGCVALFLGHELSHFYKDHNWGADFGSRFAGSGVAAKIEASEETAAQMLRYETQADETGGVLGYLAGFDTLDIVDSAFKAVYKGYGLGEELRGYPNLGERLNIVGSAKEYLERLLPLFDAGNLLFMTGRYEESGRVFDRIAREFPSREILNNAGVARALMAAALFPEKAMANSYPWSLDGQTRLQSQAEISSVRGAGETAEVKRARLLEDARDRLTDASRRDPEYGLALINLACVEELRGRRGTAIDLADSAVEIATKQQRPAIVKLARLARAIAILHGDNPEKGRAELAAIGTADDPLLAPWFGKALPKRIESAQSGEAEETISGLRVRDFVVSTAVDPVIISSSSPGQPGISLRIKWTNSYTGLSIQTESFKLTALISSANYQGRSARGISINSPWQSVLAQYGTPDQRQPFAAGHCALYKQPGLIVCTDGQDRVSRWALYAFQQQ
jgi:tetratricopeptide (TPR) repeat protein